MAIVNEVVTQFGFKGDLRPQREFNAGLGNSITLLAGVAAGIAAASGAMLAWANSVFKTIDPMVQLSRETGVALESIQELGYAASVNGSGLDAVSQSLREVTKRVGEFEQLGTGPAKEVIETLGLSFRDASGEIKAADQIMLELTGTLSRMGEAERMNVLDKLGIDPSLIQLLSLTGDEIDSLRARAQRLGIVTQEQGDAVAEYNDSLTTLRFGMQGIQNLVAVGLAPMMDDLVDRFIALLEANQDLIVNGLSWLGEMVGTTVAMLERMWPVLLALAGGFALMQVAALGLGGVLGIILSPLVLWTAGLAAALLVIDDLIVAFQGGQSVIADFFATVFGVDIQPALQAIVDGTKEAARQMVELFRPSVDAILSMLKAVGAFLRGDFGEAFGHIADSMSSTVEAAMGVYRTLGESAMAVNTAVAEAMVAAFRGAFESIQSLWDSMVSRIKGVLAGLVPGWMMRFVGDGPQAAPQAQPAETVLDRNTAIDQSTRTSQTTNSRVEQNVTIQIATSDPERAGAAVEDALQRQLETARTMSRRGGR